MREREKKGEGTGNVVKGNRGREVRGEGIQEEGSVRKVEE